MLTLRKQKAKEILSRLLAAKASKLKESQFDDGGNISFGIHEYIDIPGTKYDPEIGIIGLQACITLERPGYRIKRRRIQKKHISKAHRVSKSDALQYMKSEFKVTIGDEQ